MQVKRLFVFRPGDWKEVYIRDLRGKLPPQRAYRQYQQENEMIEAREFIGRYLEEMQ